MPTQERHKFLRWLSAAERFETDWRKDNEDNFDFYAGDQWSDYEKNVLANRGQQPTVLNVVRPLVDTLVALEMEKRTDLQVVGREESDEVLGKLLTELLKQVFDENDFDYFQTEAGKDGLIGGRGWMYAEPTEKNGFPHIEIGYIPWEEVYIDPHYRKPDGSDAKFIIRKVWMDREDAKLLWPEKAKDIDSTFNDEYRGIEYEAQTENCHDHNQWYDKQSQRVKICYCWYKDAKKKLHQVVFAEDIILEGSESDGDNGNPIGINDYPLIPFTVDRNRKGEPIGVVKSLRTIQEQLNKLNSKFLWDLSANRLMVEEDAFADESKLIQAHQEWSKPNGLVITGPGGLQKVKTEDNLRELGYLSGHMNFLSGMAQRTSGVNDSMLGLPGENERSATQQQNRILRGAAMQSRMLENLHFSKKKLAETVLKLMGVHYTERVIVRILGPNGEMDYFTLNETHVDEETGEKVNLFNISQALSYDIILQKVPPFSTIREREMQIFSEVAKTGILPPQFVGEVLLTLSDLPNKHELLEKMKQGIAQMQAAAAQQQQLSGGAGA